MKIASLLLNILNVGVLCFAGVALLPTVMMFDAPGSEKRGALWFLFWVFLAFPFLALVSLALGWARWGAGDYRGSLKWGLVAPVYGAFAVVCLLKILK